MGYRVEIEGDDAAAARAVGFGAHHALFLGLAERGVGKGLLGEETVLCDSRGDIRDHEPKCAFRNFQAIGIGPPEREQAVDDGVAFLQWNPQGIVFAFGWCIKIEGEAARNRGPFLDHALDAVGVLSGDAVRDGHPTWAACEHVLLDLAVDALALTKILVDFLVTIDRNIEVHVGPIGQRQGSVGDYQVVAEEFPASFDDFWAEQWFAAHPGALKEGEFPARTRALPTFEHGHPFVHAERTFRLVILEEVAMFAAQVAFLGDVDRTKAVARQAEKSKANLSNVECRGQGTPDPLHKGNWNGACTAG